MSSPMPAPDADLERELHPRHLRRRLVELGVFAIVVVALISVVPGLGDLRQRFHDASPGFVALAGLLELASCLSYVVAFRDVFCPRLPWGFSYNLAMAEQATNVLVPTGGAGGLALGAWALHQGGMPTEYIGRRSVAFFVLTSIPNFACAALGGALLAAHVLPGHSPLVPTIVFAVVAAATMVLVAALPRLMGWIRVGEGGGSVKRALRSTTTTLAHGVRDTGTILRSGPRGALGGAIAYMGFDVAALAAAFAAFGSPPPFGPLIVGYVIGQLGGLIPLPGGIGGTDGGLIGALVLYGTPLPQTVAAVLAYRAFQLGLPAVLGVVAFARLRRELRRASSPAAVCAPLAEPLPVVKLDQASARP
jgi:uncharacterized membrane protein YbhN (UPF0104 family)